MASTSETLPEYPARRWWRKVPFVNTRSKPLLCGDGPAQPFPDVDANWWSVLTFAWLSHLIKTGYTRPLVESEIYTLPEHRHAKVYATRLEQSWARRIEIAAGVNRRQGEEEALRGSREPGRWRRTLWKLQRKDAKDSEAAWRKSLRAEPSLLWTLNEVNFASFWLGGMFKLVADVAVITSPLLVRAILDFLNQGPEANAGRGYGLAIGLFLTLTLSVVLNVHGFYRSYTTGIILRGAIIHVVYSRALQLSERAKVRDGLGLSKLVTLISADASRIDFCCTLFHQAWTSLVQILVCLALMVYSLGYSALPGFALVLLMYPIQSYLVQQLFALRRKSMRWTDARVKTIVEAISAIRLIKTYAWEQAYLDRAGERRTKEMDFMRKRLLIRSANMAISFSIPTLAAVVSFVTYQSTGHPIQGGNSGIIFSALTFFLLLRTPLQSLPVALSSIADAKTAIDRLAVLMKADVREPPPPIEPGLKTMIEVTDATFIHHDVWAEMDDEEGEKQVESKRAALVNDGVLGAESGRGSTEKVRAVAGLVDLNWKVERGAFVCVVGSVGSGKSSLVRSLLGDMHKIKGQCRLGAPMAYCPQTAWLLSASIRSNILFGQEYNQVRYDNVLHQCCLDMDLATFSEGDQTIVGEKGISLSGGQKQRISLARAVYANTPLRIFDDCFSALDAHVGRSVFKNVMRAGKANGITQVLVTHSLQFLPYADEIVYMRDGAIVERGTYDDLLQNEKAFADLIRQHRGRTEDDDENETSDDVSESATDVKAQSERVTAEADIVEAKDETGQQPSDGVPKKEARLEGEIVGKAIMQKEERLVGSVNGSTYYNYLAMGKPALTMPLFLVAIVLFQSTTVLSPLWLQYWQQNKYPAVSSDVYMAVYAVLGIGQSLTLFCMSATFAIFVFYNSRRLHALALIRIIFAPLSFFDTTPQGRITHRFSRDVDAVDNVVGETIRIFLSTMLQAVGSIILVSIILPYFLAIAAFVLVFYIYTGMFYRPASRELRRLNNLLRSPIYEHFSESLTGLPTLRAYGALDRFAADNARRIDTENKAYWLSIACQRWLNIRLDFFGALLCLGVALLVVGLRDTILPSEGGVVLSYIVTMQTMFGQMIRQSAEIENNMNSIERLLHYAKRIEQEEPHKCGNDVRLGAEWPSRGHVQFQAVVASHRKELPAALKGVTMDIRPGEKIGIVGRTGSGKSTMLASLLRLMELSEGAILIDGVDIKTVGLNRLRSSIAVVGQDATLFKGTVRYNLDPLGQYDDALLNDVLKRVGLSRIEGETETNQQTTPLHLDFEVAEEGGNISQGQRALVSIARALIKDAKVVLIDEATASVDRKTDVMIQRTFETSLRGATVLTVAHRLNTVIGVSDRVCVMSNGVVAEMGTPTELYNKPDSIFHQLCSSASIDATVIQSERDNKHI